MSFTSATVRYYMDVIRQPVAKQRPRAVTHTPLNPRLRSCTEERGPTGLHLSDTLFAGWLATQGERCPSM